MKKLLVTGIALVAVLIFAMPAAAETKLEIGGYYRFQGRIQGNFTLDEDTEGTSAHLRHLFRFQPAFIVSDNLRFDTKWDIFDGDDFGQPPGGVLGREPKAKSRDAIDVDRLWMTVKTPYGSFAGGRMAAGAWGLTFGDDNEEADRLRFDTKFGNFSTGFIFQKNSEQDWQSAGVSDADSDTYYLYGVYKADFGAVGLLAAYTNSKTVATVDIDKYNLLPYFDLQFGMFGVRGELIWANGEADPDVGATVDIEELAWNLEADVSFGAFKVTGGYAWVQGEDSDPLTTTRSNTFYGGIGDDWDMFTVMMDVDQIINGYAGLAPASYTAAATPVAFSGVKLLYGMADWRATKTLRFAVNVGMAETEKLESPHFPAGTDDKIGTEYGAHFRWDLMKNLRFSGHFGYFDSGDFIKTAAGITNLDNTYTGYYELRIIF